MTQTIPFEDIVLQKIDNRGKTPPVFSAGYPLLEVNSLSRNRLYPDISKVSKWVNGETYASWFRQYLEKDDILFSTVGTIAESAIIPAEPIYAVAQNILGFRFKSEIIDPKYALYLMRSSWFINQITGRTIETVQKSIKWSDMRRIKINLPDLDTQEKIAAILWSLDEKIELNRQMNETLEQMGRALFRHYFIDNPEAEKWDDGVLGDIIINFDSKRKPVSSRQRAEMKGEYRYFGATSVMDYVNDYLFDGKYLLLAEDGSVIKGDNTPYLQYVWGKFWVNNHAHILQAKYPFTVEYLYLLLSQSDVQSLVSGAVQLKINQKAMNSFRVKLPPNELVMSFCTKIDPMFEQRRKNEEEIQTLTTLRDTLLPRLINGKVKV